MLQPYATPPFAAEAMREAHHGMHYPVTSTPTEILSYVGDPPLVKAIGLVVSDGGFSDPVYPFRPGLGRRPR